MRSPRSGPAALHDTHTGGRRIPQAAEATHPVNPSRRKRAPSPPEKKFSEQTFTPGDCASLTETPCSVPIRVRRCTSHHTLQRGTVVAAARLPGKSQVFGSAQGEDAGATDARHDGWAGRASGAPKLLGRKQSLLFDRRHLFWLN